MTTYLVPDISCDHCKTAITKTPNTTELSAVGGVASVDVDVENKTVTVEGGDDAAIRAAIDEAGYDIAS